LSLPGGTQRLFPHYDERDLDLQRGRSLILSRLLEDGDAADLAWLTASIPEAEIAEWLARHGGRQLSRRSREFWRVVLGRDPGPVHPEAQALWPL
jgi:hypothetical protein